MQTSYGGGGSAAWPGARYVPAAAIRTEETGARVNTDRPVAVPPPASSETDPEDLLRGILRWVECESPTDDVAAVNQMVDLVEADCRTFGFSPERLAVKDYGDFLKVTVGNEGPRILILAHLDTVWPLGALPIRRAGDVVYGPGIYDMKAGAYLALLATRNVAATHRLAGTVTLLFTTDEEVGSPASRPLIEELAKANDYVLVFEPGVPGSVKISRNGSGRFWLRTRGRAAHSGVDHAAGRNAIAELSRHILKLEDETDYDTGTTFNIGVVQGGTRANVVPEQAAAHLDVRVRTPAEAEHVMALLNGLTPSTDDYELTVEGGLTRPPFDSTASEHLFGIARAVARRLGTDITGIHSNGGSDANLAASVGTQTLDGLGADGNGAHSVGEHIEVSKLPARLRFAEELLAELAGTPNPRSAGPSRKVRNR